MILLTISISWKRRQNRYSSNQTSNINEKFHSKNLNTAEKLNVKYAKIFQNSLFDDSWYEKNDKNAFGINDTYSYKTKMNFGKFTSMSFIH
jgi:hypothetical protein